MISELVMFDLPEGMTRAEVVQGMREVAPAWRRHPDLIRKTFLYDPANSRTGASKPPADHAASLRRCHRWWPMIVARPAASPPNPHHGPASSPTASASTTTISGATAPGGSGERVNAVPRIARQRAVAASR